jgi:hypothetical protein
MTMMEKVPRPGASNEAHRAGDGRIPGQECQPPPNTTDPKIPVAGGPAAVLCGLALEVELPNVQGSGAEQVHRTMHAMAEHVFVVGGLQAFECPQTSAAIHEAGHCVVDTLEGHLPTRAAIWPTERFGQTHWVGKTYGTPPWRIDDKTSADADLSHARRLLAGVVAEMRFDLDYRLGSSLDEWAIASAMIQTAAAKMARSSKELWLATFAGVSLHLRRHRPLVVEIAQELMRKGFIKGPKLRSLLEPIANSKNLFYQTEPG